MRSCVNGDFERAVKLLDAGVDPNIDDSFLAGRFKLWSGGTPLHYAAAAGEEKVVKKILNCKGNPSALDKFGRAPIVEAAERGNSKIVTVLLNEKALLFKKTSRGLVPITDKFGWNVLHHAAQSGCCAVIALLLERRIPVNSQTIQSQYVAKTTPREEINFGFTPLYIAAMAGHVKAVVFLLQNGADPLISDKQKNFPKDVAPWQEIIDLLEVAEGG